MIDDVPFGFRYLSGVPSTRQVLTAEDREALPQVVESAERLELHYRVDASRSQGFHYGECLEPAVSQVWQSPLGSGTGGRKTGFYESIRAVGAGTHAAAAPASALAVNRRATCPEARHIIPNLLSQSQRGMGAQGWAVTLRRMKSDGSVAVVSSVRKECHSQPACRAGKASVACSAAESAALSFEMITPVHPVRVLLP